MGQRATHSQLQSSVFNVNYPLFFLSHPLCRRGRAILSITWLHSPCPSLSCSNTQFIILTQCWWLYSCCPVQCFTHIESCSPFAAAHHMFLFWFSCCFVFLFFTVQLSISQQRSSLHSSSWLAGVANPPPALPACCWPLITALVTPMELSGAQWALNDRKDRWGKKQTAVMCFNHVQQLCKYEARLCI